ncbi:NUDIX hydrolase [Kibdelosporangium phytohabitans]|uniref:DNA mismatch repair protein MutT n=1 Tax=Kibdelosporangium phytohabitans TaxID=860235 RepID=A0A0N9HSG9_9PSEU|nr:NUDIX hydrolase [Kibdelosporangium phytohabitans]ALG10177.1 DNA mismatch repair protein MutT [Kibdelosporangium phytohabitans]MBE1461186.1 8-oxo-dGTP pyrophosphatase MutT (NUDIX family) [Kibdelosporangium phytohabitans]
MAELPIRDQAGNALLAVRAVRAVRAVGDVGDVGDEEWGRLATRVPASLVVVVHADTVLMMFDSWRRQWELPGGSREPGESPDEAAVRELREETGIHGVDLSLSAVAEFDLTAPRRRELLAVYRVRLRVVPRLTVNDEALAFRWWPPSQPVSGDMSPLDAEIARRVAHPLAG